MRTRYGSIRTWSTVHRWSSLIPTLFLLMLCITGLPLVFEDEIEAAFESNPHMQGATLGEGARGVDAIVAHAVAMHPNDKLASLGFAKDGGTVLVQWTTPGAQKTLDLATGAEVIVPPSRADAVMKFLKELHVHLFAGLPGTLLLGVMGLLLVVAVVSGVVLYAPFMRNLEFGTVRQHRAARVKWLDWHNLLGIGTALWVAAVGVTGAINSLHDPIAAQVRTQFVELARSYRDAPPARTLSAPSQAIAAAQAVAGDKELASLWFPGSRFSTPHHYAVFLRGTTPLTARMLSAILVDAETGQVTDAPEMAWHAKALFVSQPLHFGDYGGLPLKLLWAVFDLITIAVLVSGVYLWIRKRRPA